MNLHGIYALVIASLMVPAVALALMADRVLAAGPQMPKPFQGTWCSNDEFTLRSRFSSYHEGPCDSEIEMEITATDVTTEVRVGCLGINHLAVQAPHSDHQHSWEVPMACT